MIELTYEVLGQPIMLSNGKCDGYEVVGEITYAVEPTKEDYEEYVGEDPGFIEFLKQKYQEDAVDYARQEYE